MYEVEHRSSIMSATPFPSFNNFVVWHKEQHTFNNSRKILRVLSSPETKCKYCKILLNYHSSLPLFKIYYISTKLTPLLTNAHFLTVNNTSMKLYER